MKDNLQLSRLAYPRATLITFVGLSLLVLSVGIFAKTQMQPFTVSEFLNSASLPTQLKSTCS